MRKQINLVPFYAFGGSVIVFFLCIDFKEGRYRNSCDYIMIEN